MSSRLKWERTHCPATKWRPPVVTFVRLRQMTAVLASRVAVSHRHLECASGGDAHPPLLSTCTILQIQKLFPAPVVLCLRIIATPGNDCHRATGSTVARQPASWLIMLPDAYELLLSQLKEYTSYYNKVLLPISVLSTGLNHDGRLPVCHADTHSFQHHCSMFTLIRPTARHKRHLHRVPEQTSTFCFLNNSVKN